MNGSYEHSVDPCPDCLTEGNIGLAYVEGPGDIIFCGCGATWIFTKSGVYRRIPRPHAHPRDREPLAEWTGRGA